MATNPSGRVEFLPAKRQALILDHLRAHGASSVQALAEAVGGSLSTVRRDLDHLVRGGYLERTHGGAMLPSQERATFEGEPAVNAELHHAEKVAIGTAVAARLEPGECVIFEASSTVMEAVRAAALRDMPLTVVTNSLAIAQFAAGVPRWRVIMPGGTIRPGSQALAGEPTDRFFEGVHADVCLTSAWTVTDGVLTDATFEVASLKRAMIRSARRTLVLVASAKFRKQPAFCTVCEVTAVDELVTDDGLPADAAEALARLAVRCTVVPVARRS
jgi:DeoR/GlpR family transcriptional regulator of sugar metabolism